MASTVRHRPVPSTSPTVTSVQQLSVALKEIKDSATVKGLSESDISKCLKTAAEKSKINLGASSENRPQDKRKVKQGKASKRSCASKLCFCLKVLWLSCLVLLALCVILVLYQPASFHVHKFMHDKIFAMVRPLRLGMVAIRPYLKALGVKVFETDCLIENPFLNDVETCHCLHIKTATEIQLNETHSKIPACILDLPTPNVYVVRKAVEIDPDLTLETFQDYKETHGIPRTCLEMTSESEEGVKFFDELFDKEKLRSYLNANESWSFTWEECPNEVTPHTHSSLLPQPYYLPPDTYVSTSSLFTLSTQWGKTGHHEDSFPEESLVAVLVVLGEVRFIIDPNNLACDTCSSFKSHLVLAPGDVLIFDQRIWNYMSVTWTKYALTNTISISKGY